MTLQHKLSKLISKNGNLAKNNGLEKNMQSTVLCPPYHQILARPHKSLIGPTVNNFTLKWSKSKCLGNFSAATKLGCFE